MTTRTGGVYAALSGFYYLDDRIDQCGEAAEVLFIRSLAWCAAAMSDGFMTERQVRRAIGVGLDGIEDRCNRLVDAGLWTRDEVRGGFVVTNYLKWNRSREEIQMRRARDAARKRSMRSPSGVRAESGRSPAQPEQNRTEHTEQNTGIPTGPQGPVRSESPRGGPPPAAVAELRAKLGEKTRRARR